MTSSSSQIPDDKTIGNISDLQSQEIKDLLQKAGIKFDEQAVKPRLQALLALNNLGVLKKGDTPDETLVTIVADWCYISVKKLVSKLKYKGLDVNGTRWKHIEVLIRAELDNGESALAKMNLAGSGDKTESGKKATLSNSSRLTPRLTPSPALVNLFLTRIYAEVAQSDDLASFPGCATATVKLVLDQLNTFPAFKTPQDLEAARKATRTPAETLLHCLCNTHGVHLAEATGSLKIKGMPSSVVQFVVSKPTPELQQAFAVQKAAKNGKSILLFHGTRLPNLRDILLTSFTTKSGKVWTAGEPWIPWDYAAGIIGNYGYIAPSSMWKGDPYTKFGVVLGCECAGEGNPTPYGESLMCILMQIRATFWLSTSSCFRQASCVPSIRAPLIIKCRKRLLSRRISSTTLTKYDGLAFKWEGKNCVKGEEKVHTVTRKMLSVLLKQRLLHYENEP